MISDGEFNGDEVNLSGTKPTKGYLIYENNKLTTGCLEFDGYKSIYSGDKFNSSEKGECELTTLYYSANPTAAEGINGRITEKVDEENISPDWKFWVKESTLSDVTAYQVRIDAVEYSFDSESDCTNVLNEMMEFTPDNYSAECKQITQGYSLYTNELRGNLGLFETENECLAKIDEVFGDDSENYCIDMSGKYALNMKADMPNYYSDKDVCYSSFINSQPEYKIIAAITNSNCVKTDHPMVVNEICGIENDNTFCLAPYEYEKSITKLNTIFSDCEEKPTYNGFTTYMCTSENLVAFTHDQGSIGVGASSNNFCQLNISDSEHENGIVCR